jgi:HlyD family secretion protein
MAKSKKRRKILIFAIIGTVIAGLTAYALLRKRDVVITIQTEKVTRRNLTEVVRANGRIQPVVQVKISPEVSGEIIELPVKEGQLVNKGDLVLKIRPDNYIAARNQTEASYKSAVAGRATAEANLQKAEAEFKRADDLSRNKLLSDSAYDEFRAAFAVAKAQLNGAEHQVEMARASLARSEEDLAKTTIVAPISGTISKLNSEVGERVVGTAMMAGSDVMTIADLNRMEARVDIGEMDVILIQKDQNVRLEVDAFKNRKFSGRVTQIANSSRTAGLGGGTSQEATKFEVRIQVIEKEAFRPGMSVTAEIETRSRSNVLAVPIGSVTSRLPKEEKQKPGSRSNSTVAAREPSHTNSPAVAETSSTNSGSRGSTNLAHSEKKSKESGKPIEVVFVLDNDKVKMVPVKIGISDDDYWEVTEGLQEGQEVVSGPYRAISRDLEDGKRVRKGPAIGGPDKDKDQEDNQGRRRGDA